MISKSYALLCIVVVYTHTLNFLNINYVLSLLNLIWYVKYIFRSSGKMAKLSTYWNVVFAIGLVMISVSAHAQEKNLQGVWIYRHLITFGQLSWMCVWGFWVSHFQAGCYSFRGFGIMLSLSVCFISLTDWLPFSHLAINDKSYFIVISQVFNRCTFYSNIF